MQQFRADVQARGSAIDELLTQYRSLTQHNPSLADPVVKAVQDDWEELLGQIENLLASREAARQSAYELQTRQHAVDEDMENFVRELERIDKAEMTMEEKGVQMQVGLGFCFCDESLVAPCKLLSLRCALVVVATYKFTYNTFIFIVCRRFFFI